MMKKGEKDISVPNFVIKGIFLMTIMHPSHVKYNLSGKLTLGCEFPLLNNDWIMGF
jgi:hypothetical protein